MGRTTKIEWCDATVNTWHGCTHAQGNGGCQNCYAETLSKRWGKNIWGNNNPRLQINSCWNDFWKLQKSAKENNQILKVFVGSMMDIFEKPMPVIDSKGVLQKYDTDYLRQEFFGNIVPNCPNLMFLLLTKRPSNINKYIPESWKTDPPANVMFGTSPVNQETADRLIPQLKEVNGNLFLSIEPQLGRISLYPHLIMSKIIWVINGGESGHGRRPFDLSWARQLKTDCKRHGVAFFFKQIDKVIEKESGIPEDLQIREFYNFVSQPKQL